MFKIIFLSGTLLFMTMGCVPLIVAGVAGVGGVVAAKKRMEGDEVGAAKVEVLTDVVIVGVEVAGELEETPVEPPSN
ncbi:MAG: hypothetical protein HOL31_02080 [Candidatus Scalindua sp.]|jgi:hypothetical protein|nr:hypothetical protein [Candidatus Scalindua sp.]MBT7349690.1 hypothetical protein [candidate division WWE3 bacterium]